MSPHMVSRDPRTKVHEIREISCDWPIPNTAKLRRPAIKSVRYSLWKNFAPRKLAKVHHRSPDLSPIDTPYLSFYRHSVVTLAVDCFI